MRLHAAYHGRSDTALIASVLALVFVLAVASLAWIYASPLTPEAPIRSDGTGYYLYLPAVLLDHDVTMKRTAARSFAGTTNLMYGARPVPPHGDYLDRYPIGEAILMTPFFAVGHVLAIVSGASRNGFSPPYEAAATAAGLTAMLVGLALLGSILRRWFSRRTVVVTLLVITFGTDLFHYGTFDATFSHAFSFMLAALTIRLSLAVQERPRLPVVIGLGASLGLVTLVRPTNLLLVAFCALIGITSVTSLRHRAAELVGQRSLAAVGIAAFIVVLIPQIMYWHAITGKLFVDAYPRDAGRLTLLHPHLLGVLFSVRKGLFFWTPVLLLAVTGLSFLRRTAPALLLPAVAYLVLFTWVTASWTIWWYGDSFGMRAFVDALPVLALGLAAIVEAAQTVVARGALNAAIAVTTLLAIHGMLAYWLHDIPYDGTTWHTYLSSFAHP